MDISGNLSAFLYMIRYSEIGPDLMAVSDDGFNVLVGSTPSRPILFSSYDRHPDIYNPRFNSTAAGGFQIIFPTWKSLCGRLGVNDFTPATQEAMAASLIEVDCGALGMVQNGELMNAVQACAREWASFPVSTSGQPHNGMDNLVAAYVKAGGTMSA